MALLDRIVNAGGACRKWFFKVRLTWTEAEYFVTKNAVKNLFLSRYLSHNKTELEGSLVCICVIFIQFGETPQSPESSNVS